MAMKVVVTLLDRFVNTKIILHLRVCVCVKDDIFSDFEGQNFLLEGVVIIMFHGIRLSCKEIMILIHLHCCCWKSYNVASK